MSLINIFEEATKQKLRFASAKGDLTLEQLWDLPLQSTRTGHVDLDGVAKAINAKLKAQEEESFVEKRSNPVKTELQLQLDIVKAVIDRKQRDNAEARARADVDARKAAIKEALANRQSLDLQGKSAEELQAELKALGG